MPNDSVEGRGLGHINSLPYQRASRERVAQILGNDTSISFEDLKKKSIFSNYDELDESIKQKINTIISKEDGSNNVTEKELSLLLTVMDAKKEFEGDTENYNFDNKFDFSENNGLYKMDNKDIDYIYEHTNTRADEQKRLQYLNDYPDILNALNNYKVFDENGKFDGQQFVSAYKYLREQAADGKLGEVAPGQFIQDALLNENLLVTKHYRDGGSRKLTIDSAGEKVFRQLRGVYGGSKKGAERKCKA